MTTDSHLLFSFGTLLDPRVQDHVFGRRIQPETAELSGHRLTEVPISDPDVVAASGLSVHRGLARTRGGLVPGGVLSLTDAELGRADAYEVDAYARRRVLLADGRQAWAYVSARALDPAERIAIVGDSIAYGRSDPSGGWVSILATSHIAGDERNYRLFNLAIPGITAADLAISSPMELQPRACDTVLIAGGINDLMGGDDVAQVVQRIARLTESVEATGSRPVIIGPAWMDEHRAASICGFSASAQRIAALDHELSAWASASFRDYVDVYSVLENRPEFFSDGIHPSPEGHRLLAERILAFA